MKLMTQLFFLMLCFALAYQLDAKIYEVNPDHSQLHFSIPYMKMTEVQGQFKKFSGEFEFTPETMEIKNLKFQAQGRSIDTNDGKRDFHLKGHEFLYTSKYPTLDYTLNDSVKLTLNHPIVTEGTLSLRGESKRYPLKLTFKGIEKDPWGKENAFFSGEFQLNRKDFGIVWNKELDQGGFLLGDIITVKISVQAQIQGQKTPFSTHMVPSTKGIRERDQLKKGKIEKLTTPTK